MLAIVLESGAADESRSRVHWAVDRLGLPTTIATATQAVLADLDCTERGESVGFRYEVQHDDSGRVDLSVFAHRPSGRTVDMFGGMFQVGDLDVIEYDLDGPEPTLAGVFHTVGGATLPDGLAAWDKPAMVSLMSGRSGQLRLVFPVPDESALTRVCDLLSQSGARADVVGRLVRAAELLTSPDSLRVAVEYLPGEQRLGTRVGLEVMIDPGLYDVFPVLEGLGVRDADAQRMRALAQSLPMSRMHRRYIPGLPGVVLSSRSESIGFVHFSVSWVNADAVLKSYLLVQAGLEQSQRERRDALVRRHGGDWTARLQWASRQLPLLHPTDETRDGLSRWRAAVDPREHGLFERRLERDGLSLDQALVAASSQVEPREPKPTWWPCYQDVVEAFDGNRRPTQTDADWLRIVAARLPGSADRDVPFAHLLWPAVAAAWQRLEAEQAPLIDRMARSVQADLRGWLLTRLSAVAAPALARMMWQDRPFGQRFLAHQGAQVADPPRTRYAAFCRAQVDDGLTDVLSRFPVLGGLLARVVDQWRGSTTELLRRLAGDRGELECQLGVPAGEPLSHVSGPAGDTHNDGRFVCVLAFGDTRVVYKPRSVQMEALYEQLVTALNRLTPRDPLRAAGVLERADSDGRDYGYMEYVEARPCVGEAELRKFYANAGRTLAVLHILAATDCHHENLIAAGAQLVLVDAETLFETSAQHGGQLSAQIDRYPAEANQASVLRVGLLPTWLWLEGRRTALDISALGVAPGSPDPVGGRGWRSINSDLMARGALSTPTNHPSSLPTLPGVAGSVHSHVDQLVDGFASTYRCLASDLAPWLGGLPNRAAGGVHRTVTRPTYVYAGLLGASVEPEALASASARARVLEKLTRAYLADEGRQTWPLVAAEQQALARLDVPYFQVRLRPGQAQRGSRLDWYGGSVEPWPGDYLADIGTSLARAGEADLRWQTSLIRMSVAASRFQMASESAETEVHAGSRPPESDSVGHACMSVVAEAGIPVGGGTTWMGLSLLPDGIRANVQSLGSGLYDGRMGLAAAFCAWSAVSRAGIENQSEEHTDRAAEVARSALAPVLRLLTSGDDAELSRLVLATGPGMNGVGGLLRGLAFLDEQGQDGRNGQNGLGDAAEIRAAQSALLRAVSPQALADDQLLDHTAGAAGIIAPLVRLLGLHDDGLVELLLRSAADVLARHQDPSTGGWRTLPATAPLTGLAHGASGIAVALAEAGVALAEPEFVAAAIRGLEYEATTYSPEARNWPDYRLTARGNGFMMGWCAGAPGVALTRLRMLQLLPDAAAAATWRAELMVAADTTASAPLLTRDHLCCGNSGRVAVLRTLASAMNDPRWDADANGIVAGMLERRGEPLPRSMVGPTSPDIPMPGLLTGLPGIGLVLLDIDPSQWVPQLLL